ncbi:MAG: hypothetical protein K0S46_2495 [Moraxellaceae bacterium]|jgi:hypothetical protein|nr:hypothetical protein [Moraxellaceae bacterium]
MVSALPRMLHQACLALLVAGFCASLHAAPKDNGRVLPEQPVVVAESVVLTLNLPEKDRVVFRGVVSLDKAGTQQQQMLYPAPDPISAVAGLMTHALMTKSIRDNQKERMQEDADVVLNPYRQYLDGYQASELQQRVLALIGERKQRGFVAATATASEGWLFRSLPVFAMTQDQRAIVMDNSISVFAPGNLKKPVYVNAVRVVSTPHAAEDLQAFWRQGEGEALKATAAALVADSLAMVLDDLARGGSALPAQKTVRYLEGATEKMERASILGDACNRLVIRTLRGWLMSVPRKDVRCAPATAPAIAG